MFSTPGTALAAPLHAQPPYHLACAAATDTGQQRPSNEDRFGVYPELGLFMVADGMGGGSAGDVAAQMGVDVVREAFVAMDAVQLCGTPPSGSMLLLLLTDAIQRANHHIHGEARRLRASGGMGTTIAAMFALGQRAALAHVGDSRVYRLRAGCLAPLTEDHSLFHAYVRAGLADPNRPEAFPHHNVITRALGTEPTVEVDARLVDVAPGDTFLLCSDGLHGIVEHKELAAILRAHADLDRAVECLIGRANELGGPDNITAILVRCEATSAVAARAGAPRVNQEAS